LRKSAFSLVENDAFDYIPKHCQHLMRYFFCF